MNPRRTPRRNSLYARFLAAGLALLLSGCFATMVESPARSQSSPAYKTLTWHLLAAPHVINASQCRHGVAEALTYVPPWGLAVGILTIGIAVPQWTIMSCVVPD